MIDVHKIKELFELWPKDPDVFIVDVAVKPGNRILVLIDRIGGLKISDCASLNRFLESKLDREKEDYELSVSSPGADSPFKVYQQYKKNIGRKVKSVTKEGKIYTGILATLNENIIELNLDQKSIKEPKEKSVCIDINEIKEIRVIISFK